MRQKFEVKKSFAIFAGKGLGTTVAEVLKTGGLVKLGMDRRIRIAVSVPVGRGANDPPKADKRTAGTERIVSTG